MNIEGFVTIMLAFVVIGLAAWLAEYIIRKTLTEGATPARVAAGVVLLLILIVVVLRHFKLA